MFHIFRRPTSATLIQRELAEADRDFLKATANAEYWSAIADMFARRRERLQGYLRPQVPPVPDNWPSITDPGAS